MIKNAEEKKISVVHSAVKLKATRFIDLNLSDNIS